jgi:hypothetical protein
MKKVCVVLAVLAAVAFVASPALAQPRPGGGGELLLLTDKGIAAELKLSEEQSKKFKELQDNQPGLMDRERFREWRDEVRKAVDGLNDAQKKRLQQLQFQQQGIGVFVTRGGPGGGRAGLNERTLRDLGVDEEGKKKLQEVYDAYAKAREELGRPDMSEEYRKKAEELRKTYLEKFVNALSGDAKKKYEELAGPPYKGEFPRPMRPGPGA